MSETTTVAITDFLLERISEDEAVARQATFHQHGATWWAVETRVGVSDLTLLDGPWYSTAAHVARHDPARVIRECAAHRDLVQECDRMVSIPSNDDTGGYAEVVLRRLASIYSDHSDFDPAWSL